MLKVENATNPLRLFFVFVLVLASAGLGAGWWVVHEARMATPEALGRFRKSKEASALSELSPERRRTLLQVEDPRFERHHGVDFSTPGAGWTTISQADVKFMYFEKFEPGLAKIRQSLIAYFVVDKLVDKESQLSIFLDNVYLGRHDGAQVRGFGNAALAYFGKPLRALSDDEFLSLVAMLPAPERFHVSDAQESNRERVARIKRLVSGACAPKGWGDVYLEGCQE